MSEKFKGKGCVITGAASGIGRATAMRFASEGAVLFLCDINEQMLRTTVQEITYQGGEVKLSQAFDISDYEQVKRFAEEVHELVGSIDILMNIAGISTWGGIEQLEIQHWRQLVEINLMGPVYMLESFVPKMIDAKQGGHIVNVSSAAGLIGLPLHAAYSATKFGVRGISEVLRFDLRRHNIHLSLVCPGAVDTGLVQTINIVGVDKTRPDIQATLKRFQKHAVKPEGAAKAIMKGVEKKKYMVFTSWDIWAAYKLQGILPFVYEWIMRLINKQALKLLK